MKTKSIFIKKIALAILLVSFSLGQAFAQTGGFARVSTGGTNVTVTNATQLKKYIKLSGKYTIKVQGTIKLSGMNKVSSNKAIIGVGKNAKITGGGFNLSGVSNVVIKNISFSNWADDAINVQNGSKHIWIDHCSFSNGGDGCVDIKRGSDYITVSWNHFSNHRKTCLLGHSDNNGSQDKGHLRVTYHHNYFNGTSSRHPRVRFSALCHVYNNYYVNNGYGVASTCGAEVLVEGCYFKNVKKPTLVGYGSSPAGDLVQRKNKFSGSGNPQTRGSVPGVPYGYSLDNASSVPNKVKNGAGAGKSSLKMVNPNSTDESIEPIEAEAEITVYPNPANNYLNVVLPDDLQENSSIRIINNIGQLVIEQPNISGELKRVDISNLNPGMYILQVSKGQKIINEFFTKN